MMNQFWAVGRLVAQPEAKESENGKKYMNFDYSSAKKL